MARVNIKPLSVNTCWQGQRFKTKDYEKYERQVFVQLVRFKMPEPPYKLTITVGLSNKLSDLDNCLKPFIDILQKKYKFNDRDIFEIHAKKEIVGKGKEFVEFSITTM